MATKTREDLRITVAGESRRIGFWTRAVKSLAPDGLGFAYHLEPPTPDPDPAPDPDRAVTDPAVDLVIISSTMSEMNRLAQQCLAAGKPFLLDGPVGDWETTRGLFESARRRKLWAMLCDTERGYPPYEKALELATDGALGLLSQVRIKLHGGLGGWGSSRLDPAWADTEARRGLWSLIRFASAFLGPVGEAFCMGPESGPVAVLLKFVRPGRHCVIEVVDSPSLRIRTGTEPEDVRIEITGSRGYLWLNHKGGETLSEPVLSIYHGAELHSMPHLPREPFLSFRNSILLAVESLLGDPKSVDIINQEVLGALKALDAAELSGRESRPIQVQ